MGIFLKYFLFSASVIEILLKYVVCYILYILEHIRLLCLYPAITLVWSSVDFSGVLSGTGIKTQLI